MTARPSADEILFESLGLDAAQRDAFVARACGDDAALRAEVRSLLAAHARAGEFLRLPDAAAAAQRSAAARDPAHAGDGSFSAGSDPAGAGDGSFDAGDGSFDAGSDPGGAGDGSFSAGDGVHWVGRRLGSYAVEAVLGRGGMGVVLLAQRADRQFEKRVAIKVIRAGMASADVLQRFRTERQVLARLDHPHIARLLDGGATEEGLPFLVMECVDGRPIDRFCGDERLSVAARLLLFQKVCAAVQHAHQHLVVHRDLKPGNILVTAEGEPRLLDFGIAKVLDADGDAAGEPATAPAMRVLTPRYASPEQLQGRAVTTASDVYALGVILYELLTGVRPFSPAADSAHAMERAVTAQPPTRPSTAVRRAASARAADGPAARPPPPPPGPDARRLSRRLAGDLDTIVLTALQRDPARRYASVAQLSEDIRRHLAGLPVSARPDTLRYRATKFVRRHAAGVAAAALLGVCLLGAAVVSALLYLRADAARVDALRAEAEAGAQRGVAEQINAFLQEMLASPDPARAGPNVLARTLLDTAAARIADSPLAAAQPEIEAAVRATLGNTYRALGLLEEAEPHLERSRALRRAAAAAGGGDAAAREGVAPADGGAALERVAAIHDLALLRHAQARHDEAETLYREALAWRSAVARDGPPRLADIQSGLAGVHSARGEFDAAETLFREALAAFEALHGGEHPRVATGLDNLGTLLHRRGELAAAEPLLRRALDIRTAALGGQHYDVVRSLSSLGLVLRDKGEHAAAEGLFVEAVRVARLVAGEQHPEVATALNNLAVTHLRRGNPDAAEAPIREALAIRRALRGDHHPEVAATLNSLAALLRARGSMDEARRHYNEAIDIYRRAFSNDHPETVTVMNNLAALLYAQDDLSAATQQFREVLAARRRVLPGDHPDLAVSLNNLAVVVLDRREFVEAADLLREAIALQRRVLPPGHPNLAGSLVNLGAALVELRDYEQAEQVLREGVEIRAQQLAPTHPSTGVARLLLGLSMQGQGRFDEGTALVEEGSRVVLASGAPRQKRTALDRIVRAYKSWNRDEAAVAYRTQLAELQAADTPP